MKTIVFWVISIFTLVFWAFSIVDMVMTLSGNEAYLKDFPPQMIIWIQDFPLWRKVLWGLTVLIGTLGSISLILRRASAPFLLWSAALLMLLGFVGHDIFLANGIKYYGQIGIISSSVLIGLAFVLAIHASFAARRKSYKR